MEDLPLELVEAVYRYLPLKDVVVLKQLTPQTQAAARRQLRLRCETINLSSIQHLKASSIRRIVQQIGPYLNRMNVDVRQEHRWVPLFIASCPYLEGLKYLYRVDSVCPSDLERLRFLGFTQMDCDEDMVREYLVNCCPNLYWLTVDRTNCTGSFLSAAPISLRNLCLTNSRLRFKYLADYLKTNRNVKELCFHMQEDKVDLSILQPNLQHIQSLSVIGQGIVNHGFEHLAKLPKLTRLDIQITNSDFYKYPEAINDNQKLVEMNLTINSLNVTYKFAESFENFMHLSKLTICIGVVVGNAKLLLRYLNYLGKYGKLETLVLAGCTQYLELDESNYKLRHIKRLRVCNSSICQCSDHFKFDIIT